MDNLFLFLVLLSFAGLIIGLIKPAWVRMPSRRKVSIVFGIAIVAFFVLFGATSSPTPSTSLVADSNAAPVEVINSQPAAPLTDEDKLKAIATSVFKDRLRNANVAPQSEDSYAVLVEFNGSDNLTTNLIKMGIEKDMSDLYIAMYASGIKVDAVSAAAYLPLTDQYGNTSDGLVYRSRLSKGIADKVNWNADKATLELQILPGVWDTSFFSPALQSK